MSRYTKHRVFKQIPLNSPILVDAIWMLQPARTGWQAEINYNAFLTEFDLQPGDQVELKLEATVYPNGKGQSIIQGFSSKYGLPIEYYKQGEAPSWYEFSDDRKYSHRIGQVISQAIIHL
ncbi:MULTISPECIES: hypothetical protein [unclassified Pseudoalteromonas]|uniref:hypothetical protein n=1 Tax=unclassified Pseudoalteromonas TaxID=194690 RepID=UPI001601D63D|nr:MULTISPECIES: hypothetical protein [unclassified Pseudoalteromonas]MBB1336047.1 hypothetical protein [Pseudoalteromonas sp. SR41-6]MBB1461621.1 hypothetical protein [Pseudoalteromonas sp. SG41-8]